MWRYNPVLKSLRNALGVVILALVALMTVGGFSPAHAADTDINGVLTTQRAQPWKVL
jgi:hypothetical protein